MVPVYEYAADGTRTDTGERRPGKTGNTMAVIHLKNTAKARLQDDLIAFQHGKVEVRWADNDNLYACGYVDLKEENPNTVALGSGRGRGLGRGGYQNKGGRGGKTTSSSKTKHPPPKKAKLTGQSNLREWPEIDLTVSAKGQNVVRPRKDSQETIVLTPMDTSQMGRFWEEIAKEYTDYVDSFYRKAVPELNHHIKVFQEVSGDCYNGPEMSVAGASTDTTTTVQGVKTLKNQKKKKGALMRKCVTAVLELRKRHVSELGKFHTALQVANTAGNPAALQLMEDIKKETDKTLETIMDPQKVEMVPHSII